MASSKEYSHFDAALKGVNMKTKQQIRGSILGALVGDALGVPYQFEKPVYEKNVEWKGFGAHLQPMGTWSDDGALLLCAVESLGEKGHFDASHLATRFLLWQAKGHMACGKKLFDIGNTTVEAFYRMRNGVPPLEAGLKNEFSCGNGSLMRILPHALFHPLNSTEERLIEIVQASSAITHGHPLCQVSCALYCILAHNLFVDKNKRRAYENAVARLKAFYESKSEYESHLAELERLLSHKVNWGSGFVADTFHTSLKAFFEADSFQDALKKAVSFGKDTDTVASITGGLAGLFYGEDEIPSEWRTTLRLELEHERVIERFLERVGL